MKRGPEGRSGCGTLRLRARIIKMLDCRVMRKSLLCFLTLAIFLSIFSTRCRAQLRPKAEADGVLLVANQEDRNLSIIDPVAARQIAVVPEGGITGHEVAASPDGRTAYVPIYGDSGVGKPGTDGRNMVVVDMASHTVVGNVDFGHGVRPHCVVYDRNSGLLYVTTELDQTVTAIDPHTLKIVRSIPTTQPESHMLAISHDGRRGYTANVSPGSVSVLDMAARKTITVIPISANTQRISISNDDRMVFTADQTKPQLAVIDTADNKIKTWITLPAKGYGAAATIDGRWLLIATQVRPAMPSANPGYIKVVAAPSQVAVINLATLKLARTIPVPGVPQEILVSPDGQSAYVSCMVRVQDLRAAQTDRIVEKEIGQVAVIDLANWKMKSLIDAGKGADGLAWAAAQ